MNQRDGKRILVVDDDPDMLDAVTMLLSEDGYNVTASSSAGEAMDQIKISAFDVVLTDIKMPVVSGIELLEQINDFDPEMPVIMMTAYADLDLALNSIKRGAFDFFTKPIEHDYLLRVIDKAITHHSFRQLEKEYKRRLEIEVSKRTSELRSALARLNSQSKEVILRLTGIAEFRDTDTGAHIRRVGLYAREIARSLNMPSDFIEAIAFASSLHDIGKIGIKDRILLKAGELDPEEFETMKTHCVIGEKMLLGSSHVPLQMAASVALTHHEKWDGSGYPRGLKGDEAPIEGRITVICDQYDALRSNRPYKDPLSHEKTFRIITEGDSRTIPGNFDPDVMEAFKKVAPEFERIFADVVDLY